MSESIRVMSEPYVVVEKLRKSKARYAVFELGDRLVFAHELQYLNRGKRGSAAPDYSVYKAGAGYPADPEDLAFLCTMTETEIANAFFVWSSDEDNANWKLLNKSLLYRIASERHAKAISAGVPLSDIYA